MSYSVVPNRANPMAILFVVDQSGSMSDRMPKTGNTKADQVATVINKMFSELITKATKQDGVRHYYDVGVIGYGHKGVYNALQGSFSGQILNPIDQIAANPLRVEKRMNQVVTATGDIIEVPESFSVWFDPVASGGTPMSGAMELAAETIAPWCDAHPTSFPPVIIHITDGEYGDGDPSDIAEGIKTFTTSDGNVLLCNLHISSGSSDPISFPDDEIGLPDQFAKTLFRMSSVIPESMHQTVKEILGANASLTSSTRFFTFNGNEVDIVKFLRVGTQGTQPVMLTYGGER
ncbi:MAG: VWA domain-containing protein [Kiritimatiellae bacterium]|nr:VWA domain-containing protein [Kiritimatiellia bacterium]